LLFDTKNETSVSPVWRSPPTGKFEQTKVRTTMVAYVFLSAKEDVRFDATIIYLLF